MNGDDDEIVHFRPEPLVDVVTANLDEVFRALFFVIKRSRVVDDVVIPDRHFHRVRIVHVVPREIEQLEAMRDMGRRMVPSVALGVPFLEIPIELSTARVRVRARAPFPERNKAPFFQIRIRCSLRRSDRYAHSGSVSLVTDEEPEPIRGG